MLAGALLLSLTTCLVLRGHLTDGARILAVLPIPSVSHQVVYRALMLELHRRGHQMVVVTPDPVNDPDLANYTEVDVSVLYKVFQEKHNIADITQGKPSPRHILETTVLLGEDMCEMLMGNKKVQAMTDRANTKEHFDLVFLEWFTTPCTVAFSHRFTAPTIGVASFPLLGFLHDSVGNPTNPSYIPEIVLPYTDKNRSFLQRLETVIFNVRFSHFFYGTAMPKQDAISKRYFGSSTPYIGDLYRQVDMLFVNYVPGFHNPTPNVPAIVHFNGINIKTPRPLPEDIQQFLDSAPKGVIYFSLGSNVRSDQLTADKRRIFLEAFAELPDYHVLWKWESDNLPGQPKNVKIAKWMPQQDILRHPKVKVFITQGGLQSTEEAIHMKVPMIGIPFFADQFYNTKLGEDRGVTIRLDIKHLTKTTFLEALMKVLKDKSYRENMERLSAIVSDQMTTPLERAVWWTEYVLRHKGAKHLRTAAVDMPWYTYLLLDVVLFLLVTALMVVVLLWVSVRYVYRTVKIHLAQKEKTN